MKSGTAPEPTLKNVAEDRAEVEGDRVVEERLADEQREAEDRPPRVVAERDRGDLAERDRRCAGGPSMLVVGLLELLAGLALRPRRSISATICSASSLAAVDEEPARALGHVAADAGSSPGRAPRRSRRRAASRGRSAKIDVFEQRAPSRAPPIDRAEPVAAVDDQVDAAAHARRDQLVDRRVDRRVLAADAHAGEEAAERRSTRGRTRRRSPRSRRCRAPSVIVKSRLRPKRSVSWPKKSAPTQAPAT